MKPARRSEISVSLFLAVGCVALSALLWIPSTTRSQAPAPPQTQVGATVAPAPSGPPPAPTAPAKPEAGPTPAPPSAAASSPRAIRPGEQVGKDGARRLAPPIEIPKGGGRPPEVETSCQGESAVDAAAATAALEAKLGAKVVFNRSANELVIAYDAADQLGPILKQILGPNRRPTAAENQATMSQALRAEVKILEAEKRIVIRVQDPAALDAVKEHVLKWKPPLVSITGFVLMLLSIAIIPLVSGHWWERNKNKAIVSLILGVPLGVYVIANDWVALAKSFHEYEQFIILLLALFVISGGVLLTGDVRATPRNNSIFLLIGAVLASLIGTTGASMLLIRPLLTTNRERRHIVHTVIFFIFVVSNIGGSLTPLGDPPLFLGYLKGVPFAWTLKLWPYWLGTCAWLIALYFVIDTYIYNKKESDVAKAWDRADVKPIRLQGGHNFFLLGGVILSIYFYPNLLHAIEKIMEGAGMDPHNAEYVPIREALMLSMAVLSWKTTKMEFRKAQNFTWSPIVEVAVLFAAIFVTMIPALLFLNNWGPVSPVREPWLFFWATGVLSSFLDNAPTYLVFLSLGEGQGLRPGDVASFTLNSGGQIREITLLAVSVAAVFMGANTYIGNAPNFMVKSISEENHVKMPSFFGYMAWSVGILVPTFIVITLIAFVQW